MAALKFIMIFAILISIVIAVEFARKGPNKGHDLIVGVHKAGDRMTYRENIVKNSEWFRIVKVTKTFNATKNQKITFVNATDLMTDGTGAYATILSGGPSWPNVTIKFKSQRGYGINFIVELFSR